MTATALIKHSGPHGLRKARVATLAKTMKPGSPSLSAALPEQIKTALAEQTVAAPGSDSTEIIIPRLAQKLKNTLAERKTLEQHLEERLCKHPLSVVLISMPGVAVRTASNILSEIGSIEDFATRRTPRQLCRPSTRYSPVRLQHCQENTLTEVAATDGLSLQRKPPVAKPQKHVAGHATPRVDVGVNGS